MRKKPPTIDLPFPLSGMPELKGDMIRALAGQFEREAGRIEKMKPEPMKASLLKNIADIPAETVSLFVRLLIVRAREFIAEHTPAPVRRRTRSAARGKEPVRARASGRGARPPSRRTGP